MPHHGIFIIQPEIGTFALCAREETIHLVLIQIHQAAIALIVLVVHIVDTCVTIRCCHLLASIRPSFFPVIRGFVQMCVDVALADAAILGNLLHRCLVIHSLLLVVSHMLFDRHALP